MIGMEIYMVEMIPMMHNRNPTDAVNASFEHDHFFRPWIGARSQLGEACKPKGTLYAENSGGHPLPVFLLLGNHWRPFQHFHDKFLFFFLRMFRSMKT